MSGRCHFRTETEVGQVPKLVSGWVAKTLGEVELGSLLGCLAGG